jgi:hypothetical protein
MPKIPPKSKMFSIIRWWTLPIIFMSMCWTLLMKPELLKTYWIQSTILDIRWLLHRSFRKVLPIFPKNMLEAFDFSTIVRDVEFAVRE